MMKGDKLATDTVKKVYVDGVNNLEHRTGKIDESARDDRFPRACARTVLVVHGL